MVVPSAVCACCLTVAKIASSLAVLLPIDSSWTAARDATSAAFWSSRRLA
jgi:hypothetical protein